MKKHVYYIKHEICYEVPGNLEYISCICVGIMSVDPKLKSIPNGQLTKTYTYFWSIPVIQMCRNMIRQNLFSNGIDFKGKSGQSKQNFSQKVIVYQHFLV